MGGLWELQLCRFVEIFRRGGSTQQPQSTEPCQCASGQPWAYHGALQGQMQPLQCAQGVVRPARGVAAGLGRWFVGVAVAAAPGQNGTNDKLDVGEVNLGKSISYILKDDWNGKTHGHVAVDKTQNNNKKKNGLGRSTCLCPKTRG